MSERKSNLVITRKVVLISALLLSFSMVLPLITLASTNNRLAGADRFQTARIIAEQSNPGTVQEVILTTGYNFPDALSVSVLAKNLNAPILLVKNKAESSSDAFTYITQHLSKSGTVHIIGGTGVIDSGFEAKLNQLGFTNKNMDRIGGYDRYNTDNLIAQKLAVDKNTPVVIASGENFPDALSISSVASNKGWPILLVGKNYLPQDIKNYLSQQQPSQVYIVGGTEVISQSVKNQIQSLVSTPIKLLAGQDRFDTNGVIVKAFGVNPKTVYLATGFDFADALSGSVLAAKTGDPIVLIDPSKPTLTPSIASYLSGLHSHDPIPNPIAFGGIIVVPEATLKSVSDLVMGTAKEDSIYSVSDIAVTLSQYQDYALPTTVIATLYNSSNVNKAVKWNVSKFDTSKAGSSVLEGKIDGYNLTIKLTLKVVGTTIKTIQYGTSGEGRPLYVTEMEVPKPNKVVLVNFEIHGWEDSYGRDGQVLVNIGNAAISYFTAHPNELKSTSLYVVSSSNPDGLIDGLTNNGPGRCQISLGVDINRDFDYRWILRTNARNKTLAPFSSPEAQALRNLVLEIHPTDVIDIHGWENTTYGSPDLCRYFQTSLGIGYSSGLIGASGYFTSWATMYANRTALIELPGPSTSPNPVINALKSLCNG